jgi:hypothetical protein
MNRAVRFLGRSSFDWAHPRRIRIWPPIKAFGGDDEIRNRSHAGLSIPRGLLRGGSLSLRPIETRGMEIWPTDIF